MRVSLLPPCSGKAKAKVETRLIEEGWSIHCSSALLCSLLLKFQTWGWGPEGAPSCVFTQLPVRNWQGTFWSPPFLSKKAHRHCYLLNVLQPQRNIQQIVSSFFSSSFSLLAMPLKNEMIKLQNAFSHALTPPQKIGFFFTFRDVHSVMKYFKIHYIVIFIIRRSLG